MNDHTTQLQLFTAASNDPTDEIPYGYCACGCGQLTTIPDETNRNLGRIKGVPMQFVSGHNRRQPVENRFWAKVDKSGGPDACWEWTGSRDKNGYGTININRKIAKVHRVSWELHNGPIPEHDSHHGICVLHSCDNPPCVNPAHLFLGTNSDNVSDRDKKGRQTRGETHANAKLTAEDVREIRRRAAKGDYRRDIARDHGIRQDSLHKIIHRKTWKHV